MRKTFYFADGPHRVITSTGHLFYFGEPDDKIEKAFVSNPPVLKDTSVSAICHWYELFVQHAARHGIYLHPYFSFQSGTSSKQDFTCGDDTDTQQFDLLGRLFHRLEHWLGKI